MIQTTVGIDGMMCGMCEAHINDCIRANFPVKSVSSSHKKGEAVILSEEAPEVARLRDVIGKTGYVVTSVHSEEYQKKKGFFSRFFEKKRGKKLP